MIRRDYLQKQIDQLGKALGKLLTDLTGLKNEGKTTLITETADQQLKIHLNQDLEELASVPVEQFVKTLQEQKTLSDDSLSLLADIMFVAAEQNSNDALKRELFRRCLEAYNYLDNGSSVYSFERHIRIDQIKNSI